MMIAHTNPRGWIAGLALTTVALACTLPSGQDASTPTITAEVTLPALATVITAPEDCTATANQDINMRAGPGKAWPVVSQLASSNSAKVTGHNGDKSWWQLNDSAWVSAPLTTLSGNCANIQVVGFPPPPQADNPPQQPQPTQQQQPTPPQLEPPTNNAPTQAPTNAPSVNLAFEVDYNITWFCGNDWRVSFIVHNQGNVNIESVYYSVEAPTGHYLNSGTINNSPFETTAKESQPACALPVGHGQSSLAPGNSGYVPINLSPVGAGVTQGFLYFEACTQNNRTGVCEGQVLYFTFTT